MKFYILIMKNFYSNSENFQKCSVCVRFAFFLAYLLRKRACLDSRNGDNKCIVVTPVEQRSFCVLCSLSNRC